MSAWPYTYALDGVAQKWRALAERRRAHFVELYDSGRWKRYYSEEQFLHRMREAIRLTEQWADVAPRAADEVFAAQARAAADDMARRTAA
jgi:uncharacterized repeat protein (TIGR03809 family)